MFYVINCLLVLTNSGTKKEERVCVPVAVPGFIVVEVDLPDGNVPLDQVVLVLAEETYGKSIMAMGEFFYPMVDTECSAILTGPVDLEGLDEVLDILNGLDEDSSPSFAAAIAAALTDEAKASVLVRAENPDGPYVESLSEVFAILTANAEVVDMNVGQLPTDPDDESATQ